MPFSTLAAVGLEFAAKSEGAHFDLAPVFLAVNPAVTGFLPRLNVRVGNQFRAGILDSPIREFVQVKGIAIAQSPSLPADRVKRRGELCGGFSKSLSLLAIRFEAKPYRSVHNNISTP